MAMPQIYYRWREWVLGEGKYKAYGPRHYPVRPPAPRKIPMSWWVHLATFLAARKTLSGKPIQRPPTMFTVQDGVFFRNPRGGVEDIKEMHTNGYQWFACNVGDHSHVEWQTVRERCHAERVACIPWARCRTEFDVDNLMKIAVLWNAPGVIVNLENEAETTLPPRVVKENILGFHFKGAVAISTLGWLQNSVDWTPFRGYDVLLQYFPVEVPQYDGKLVELIRHAKDLGCDHVGVTFGTYGHAIPQMYPIGMIHSLYTGDDVGPGNWWRWA